MCAAPQGVPNGSGRPGKWKQAQKVLAGDILPPLAPKGKGVLARRQENEIAIHRVKGARNVQFARRAHNHRHCYAWRAGEPKWFLRPLRLDRFGRYTSSITIHPSHACHFSNAMGGLLPDPHRGPGRRGEGSVAALSRTRDLSSKMRLRRFNIAAVAGLASFAARLRQSAALPL